jgi:hypothetical protein
VFAEQILVKEEESVWPLKRENSDHQKHLFISVRKAKLSDAPEISTMFFEWLKQGTMEGRLREIRKVIRAKEIVVSQDLRTCNLVGLVHGIMHNDPISGGAASLHHCTVCAKRV